MTEMLLHARDPGPGRLGDARRVRSSPAPTVRPASERSPRVVVADDQTELRDAIVELLEQSGFDVVGVAGDGDEAIRAATSNEPAAVLMDVKMPRVDGIDATAEIRRRLPETRVVMFSAYDDAALREAALSAGAVGYVTKGEGASAIVAALRNAAGDA